MVRLNITIHAEDAESAADVLENYVIPKVRGEYREGYERGEDGERYYFEVVEYEG